MKKVKDFIRSIFEHLNVNNPQFEVYKQSNLPSWLKDFFSSRKIILSEFVIVSQEIHLESRLQRFLNVQIFRKDSYIFWLFGEKQAPENFGEDSSTNPLLRSSTNFKNRHLFFPDWLDSFIFEKKKATYCPQREGLLACDKLTDAQIKIYLGTYFPRSFAESFTIISNLLSNPDVYGKYSLKKHLKLYAFGCGTGGEILGLIHAISVNLPLCKKISILAHDSSQLALSSLTEVLYEARKNYSIEILIETECFCVSNHFYTHLDDTFDFIFAFKTLSELQSYHTVAQPYLEFCENFASKLSTEGFLLILDLTSKNNDGKYLPLELRAQVRQFLNANPDFRLLIPIPCGHHQTCQENCYGQVHFRIFQEMRNRINESRVFFEILIRREFYLTIAIDTQAKYKISDKAICKFGSTEPKSAYEI